MALEIELPANGWVPREYQKPLCRYLWNGGKHAEVIWHRRAGKDDVVLHWTALAAIKRRVGNYWHMLPQANQSRKAIWEAVNPHTGKRRIDEAFPKELRAATRDNDMLIRFINGSTWQVLGSDNYEGAIGSTPCGIVYSEWAQSKPSSRGYLRPILAENNGWQVFITTPRGNNHAKSTYDAARKDPEAFAQLLTATDTGVFNESQLEHERQELIAAYGLDLGEALFSQEYMCSFTAAIPGAYYTNEFAFLDANERLRDVPYQPEMPVHTAWDLGHTDDTAIWWFQVAFNEIHIIDFYVNNGKDIPHYCGILKDKPYKYGTHYLPHDAKAKTLASGGKSIQEQLEQEMRGYGIPSLVPTLSVEDGIQASRKALKTCYFDETKCADGIEALRQYKRKWDEEKRVFSPNPEHDWCSHPADAFRYLSVAWQAVSPEPEPESFDEWYQRVIKPPTMNELWEIHDREQDRAERI